MINYPGICFVIMPFGSKEVGDRRVDFDAIYQLIFDPAIRLVQLPEGGALEPRRTDQDFFAGDISLEMFTTSNTRGSRLQTSPVSMRMSFTSSGPGTGPRSRNGHLPPGRRGDPV